MAKIDLSMKKLETFADDLERYMGNLSNTAKVFEDIVAPVAKSSGSDLLVGVSDDVRELGEEFDAKKKTAQRAGEGLKEYTKSLDRINQLN